MGYVRPALTKRANLAVRRAGRNWIIEGFTSVYADCEREANSRLKVHCRECGAKLPKTPALNWTQTEQLVDVCSDCQFVKYLDGAPVKPDRYTAFYLGGYAAFPEPQHVLMLTYPDHLEVPELDLDIPYGRLQNVQTMTEERLRALDVFLVGILAFAWKNREDYLVITFSDAAGIEQNPVFDVKDLSEIQPFLYEQMVGARTC
jgi:hypothetical protein